MAASLTDLFDGAQTTNATSSAQAITKGDYYFVAQGTPDGAKVILELNVHGSEYDPIDGKMEFVGDSGFKFFSVCAGNIRAVLSNAGSNTSLTVSVQEVS